MSNSHSATSWRQHSRKRLKKMFTRRYIPTLPTSSLRKSIVIILIAFFSFSFLSALTYLSFVSLVLNIRYYATQIVLRNQPFKITRVVLTSIAFNPNIQGSTKHPQFGLVIPKIGVDAPVIPQVDPNNYKDYMRVLKKGVALAKGSSYPDQNGVSYIFAHSTNLNPYWISYYNAVFYLLNKLKPGDQIFIWYHNKKYTYIVNRVFITSKDDKSFLFSSQKKLVLQTCYPPGTSLKRLIVIAYPLDHNDREEQP